MVSQEDRNFYESLNKNLATNLETAINKALGGEKGRTLKKGGRELVALDSGTIKDIGTAVGKEVGNAIKGEFGKGGKDKDGEDKGDSEQKERQGAGVWKSLKDITKGTVSFLAQSRLLSKALTVTQSAFAYGDIVAKGAALTGNQSLLGPDLINDTFKKFGHEIEQVGRIFETAMRANLGEITEGTSQMLARASGFGVDGAQTSKFQAMQVNQFGRSETATHELINQMLDLGVASKMYATSILDAVQAMAGLTRAQQAFYGGGVSSEFQRLMAVTIAGTEDRRLADLAGPIQALFAFAAPATGKADAIINLERVAAQFGGNIGDNLTSANAAERLSSVIGVLVRAASETTGSTDVQTGRFREGRLGRFGVTSDILAAAQAIDETFGGPSGFMDALQRAALTTSERSDQENTAAATIQKSSIKVSMSMVKLQAATEMLKDTFGITEGVAGGVNSALESMKGWLGKITMYGGLANFGANILSPILQMGIYSKLAFGGGGGGAGGGLLARGVGYTAGGFRGLGSALTAPAWAGHWTPQTAGGTPNWQRIPGNAVGGFGKVTPRMAELKNLLAGARSESLASNRGPLYEAWKKLGKQGGSAGFETFKGTEISKLTKELGKASKFSARYASNWGMAAKASGRRMPVFGSLLSAGFEYSESGDLSRAGAAGIGGGAGGWLGGAAAGALAGTMGAGPIGTVVGAIAGAIIGGFTGEKLAVGIHDVVADMGGTKVARGGDTAEDMAENIAMMAEDIHLQTEVLRDQLAQAENTDQTLAQMMSPRGTQSQFPTWGAAGDMDPSFIDQGIYT